MALDSRAGAGRHHNVESCRDPDQTADILTKALHRTKHNKHAQEMGLAPA